MGDIPAMPFEPEPRGDGAGLGGNGKGPGKPGGEGEDPGRAGGGRRRDWLPSLGKWIASSLDWIFTRLTSPAITSALIALVAYARFSSDALRVLPLDAAKEDGAKLAVQLSQALEAVDAGARTGIDEGLDGFRCTTTAAPTINLPGVNIPIAALMGFLGETQVQGQLVGEAPRYRVRLQISGRRVPSERVETDPKASVDEAMTEAAERLYAVVHPVNGAYYYFSRYPNRALEILQRALDDKNPGVALYRVWGLTLGNLRDYNGALEMLGKAAAVATKPQARAHIYVEMGYAATAAGRWRAAAEYFDRASQEDTTWPVPAVRKADALREQGDLDGALLDYERAGSMKPSFGDAWVGVGRVWAAKGQLDEAILAYEIARRFTFDKNRQASLLRDIGDAIFALGCTDEAATRYMEAMDLASTYEPDRAKGPGGQACPHRSERGDVDASRCVTHESQAIVG